MFCGPTRVRAPSDRRSGLWGKPVNAIRYQIKVADKFHDRGRYMQWAEAVAEVVRPTGVRALRGPMGSGDGEPFYWSAVSHDEQRERCNLPFLPCDRRLRGAEAQ